MDWRKIKRQWFWFDGRVREKSTATNQSQVEKRSKSLWVVNRKGIEEGGGKDEEDREEELKIECIAWSVWWKSSEDISWREKNGKKS